MVVCCFHGGIAVHVLPEVRKQAGKVIAGISRDFSVSGHWEQKLELQLVAVRRSCNSFPTAEVWLISAQKMWDLPCGVLDFAADMMFCFVSVKGVLLAGLKCELIGFARDASFLSPH